MSTVNTKRFPHKKFLSENKDILATHPMPDLLNKRILGFEELEEDLEQTEDEDREELLNRMEDLSLELDEDLEEFYEDILENNDSQDDEPEMKPAQVTVTGESIMQQPLAAPASANAAAKTKSHLENKASEKNTDEAILENLLKSNTNVIMPDKLKAMGFKTILGAKSIQVGKYLLYKAKYALYYNIIKNH